MPEPKLSVAEFSAKVKSKYPQYKDVDDSLLVSKMLDKYPVYSEQVNFDVKKKEPSEAFALQSLAEPSASATSAEVPAAFGEIPKFERIKGKEPAKTRQQLIEEQRNEQTKKFLDLGSYIGGSIAEGVVSANTYLNRGIEILLLGNNTNYFSSNSVKILEPLNKEKERLQSEYVGEQSIGKGVVENFQEDPITGAKLLAFEAGRQIPQMYAMGAIGRTLMPAEGVVSAGLRTGSILAPRTKLVKKIAEDVGPMVPLGMSAAGQAYLDAAEKNPEDDFFDAIANLAIATYKGTSEVASELLFRTSADDLIRGGFRKGLVSDIAKSTRPTLQAAKQVGRDVAVEGFQEGLEELAVEISSNAIDALVFGEDMLAEKNIYGMADAFILGSAIGSPITLLSKGPSAIGTANNINKRRKISEEVNDLYDAHQDPTTSASEKSIVKGQIINKLAELKQVETSLASFYEEFSEEDRNNVISLNQQLSMAQLIYPKLKNEQSKDVLQEKVKEIYSEKTKIESKYDPNIKVYEYDSEKEAGVSSPVAEGQAPVEAQPVEGAGQEATPADRVLQAREKLILESVGMDATLQAVERGDEVEQSDVEAAQERILQVIDDVDKSDIPVDAKQAYIQTLEDKFDELEYYDNKTITTTEQVTEEVPIGPPRAGSRTVVEPEVQRGKFRLFERLNNLEVAVGTETEGQTSVIETQEDGSIDVVTYDKNTKQEVSRQPKVAENILGLEYVESIFDADGNLTGVVMRPKTPKGEDISPVRIQVVNRPELALDIAIDARKKEIGTVPDVIWMQEYETVTREVTTKERVPAAKRPERKAARVVLPTEAVATEQVTEQVVEQEPTKNKKGLTSEQVTEAVSAANRLARRLGLTTKIVVHNSRKEFNDAMDEVSKSGSVASGVESGRFIPSRNEIHLNLEDMTSRVPFHEVFHAAFVDRFAKGSQAAREKTAKDFQSGILRILRNGTAQDNQIADEVEQFVSDGEYSAKESPEEFMAETSGILAVNGGKIEKSTMDKLIQWVNNFIGKISPGLKVTTNGEFIDFMNSFSNALLESASDSRDVSRATSRLIEASKLDETSSKQSDPKAVSAAIAIVNNVNNKYPEAVEQQVVSAEFKEDKFGKKGTLYDVKSIPYKLIDGAKKYFGENAADKLSDKIVSDVKKYEGNKDISKGIGWYSNFRNQFQRKFGASLELFGQLLAATSAQTPVDINFRQAIDALRQYSKGKYDSLITEYGKYVDSIEKMSRQDIIDSIEVRTKKKKKNYTDLDVINEKRKLINEFKGVPLQSNGKKFNANSAKVLQAIYGNWLSQTQGPKTKNFAGNLTGRSYEATIDVWAARYLRRIIYKDNVSRWRIHPKQEGAVEHTVSVDGITGGDYFFAEEVMRKAADKLNWNADDLQAFLWFLEKDIWSRNNWTGAAGRKKSSFEEEAEKLLTERYQAGVTTFKDFGTFNKEEFEAAKAELLGTIRAVDGLIVGRVVESEGEYYSPSGDVYAEPTFDVEFSVDEGTDVSSIEAKVIEIGKRYNQEAVLFSKITENKEKNSAPIIEIGLKNPSKNSKTIDSIKKMLSGLGVRGFTVSRDSQGNILGVRTQYIKEFEGQPISFGEILFEKAEVELRNQFEKNNDISYISSNFVETNVTFTENEKATEIPSDAKAKDDAPITGGLESSSRVAGEPSGPSRAGAVGGITESSSSQANKVYDKILKESSSKTMDELFEAQKAGLLIHATKKDFDYFDVNKIYGAERAVYGYGFYFTGWAPKAGDYGNKFIFTPLSEYRLIDVDQRIDLDFAKNFLFSEALRGMRKISLDSELSETQKGIKMKPYRDMLSISREIEKGIESNGYDTIDSARKRLDNRYLLNDREFSEAFEAIGFDGFSAPANQSKYYQVVIFNFKKLNDNLVKDEADYLKESSSRDVREEILDKEQLSFKQRAVNTAKSFVWSDTQKQIRVFKERMSSQLSVEGREIKKFTKGLNQLLKKADVQTIDLVGDIFDGTLTPENQRILESKPNGSLIFAQANSMRNYIDSFAEDFVNSPEFHAMPEETVNTIIDNFGQYMRGSYRFWKDKNFKPSNAARREAIAYEYEILRSKKVNELINNEGFNENEAGEFFELLHDETLSEATKAIDDYIADIEKIRNGSDFKKLGIISPSGIKLPSEQFLRRKELPETIQNLLGKERDPIIRFIDTTIALSNIKYKGHMLYAISESLGGTQFIKNEVTDAEKSTGEYKEVKDKFSPLNGRFVHRDVYEAITNQNIYESDNIWMSGYLTTLQLARKSKVIYNLPTWRKNLTGGWYTMAANGVVNPSLVRDLKRRAQLFANGETDAETEALIKIMGDNGIIGQDVNANLLGFTNAIYSRTLTGNDNDYTSYVARARNLIKNFDSVVGQKYAAVDDYTKLIIFRSEIQSFAKKMYGKPYDSLTDAQKNKVHAEAAEFVKQNTPTFSRLPKWYGSLAKLPAGDFLSFEFESLRSFSANIRNGQQDLMKGMNDKTLSKEQKAEYIKSGSRRLAGSAAIMGARLAITSILASLALGDDDELEEDIKNNRPNWMEGHSIIPTKVSKEGIATAYDYSMEDPYGSFFDLATDPLSFPAYVVDLLQPNMGISFLTNLAENKDFYGRDITNSYDSKLTKGYKYGGHTLKSLIIPPFIASSYRDEQKRLEAEADKYSPLDAVGRFASRAVIRDYEFNIPVQFYYFTDQFRTKKEQYSDLTGASRDNRLAELDEIKKMYKSITNIGIKKGNFKMIADANKNIKRALKPNEEAYVLYGYEIPEKK